MSFRLFPAASTRCAPLSGVPASRLFLALTLGAMLLLHSACSENQKSNKKGEGRKQMAPPVSIGMSAHKDIPVEIQAVGHVEPSATVGIRSQVTGTLNTIHFHEGSEVKAGDLLFSIDPTPFANRLSQAEAALAKTRADLANARTLQDRYSQAVKKGYVAAEQADQAATKVAMLIAAIQADEAAAANARLELAYCQIRSPLTGYTGQILTDAGNQIKANADSPMVTINQIEPVFISFAVPDKTLGTIRKQVQAGPLKVLATPPGGTGETVSGELSFIDNAVDQTTGTIRLKSTFANRKKSLWPGQTVDIGLQLATRMNAVVIPSRALQNGQNGPYVYTVKEDLTVEYREVSAGPITGDETVIESGVQAGEKLVTDGMMQLADGMKVEERGGKQEQKADQPDKSRGPQ